MWTSPEAVVAIVGMAVVTYLTRIGGMLAVSRLRATGRVDAFLRAVPGAVIASIVAPTVLGSGPAEALAGAAVLGLAIRTRNILVSMTAGVLVVWGLRQIGM